jgi:hypothetical protein
MDFVSLLICLSFGRQGLLPYRADDEVLLARSLDECFPRDPGVSINIGGTAVPLSM